MIESAWQRLDQGIRHALPLLTTILAVLLGTMVWPLPYLGSVAPPFAIIALYYWTMHRPDLFRPGAAFVVGLLNDVVHYLPLGLSALLFVAAHQVLLRQRRFFISQSFLMIWFGFVLTVVVVELLQWIALAIIRWQMVPFMPVFVQTIIACASFPLPCWLLILVQRKWLQMEH